MPTNSEGTTCSPAQSRGPWVAVFDLDGTLTWRDTLVPYLFGYLLRHPSRWVRLWRLPAALMAYLVAGCDRGALKARIIDAVLGGESGAKIDRWSEDYVGRLAARHRFRPAALAMVETHRAAGDHLVLLSASPDLYVPRIGRLLGFDRTLCTALAWDDGALDGPHLTGALKTPHRRGEDKSRCLDWLRGQYRGLPVVAYGNSGADLPHMLRADRALLVNGSPRARRPATIAGVPTGEWR